MLPDNLLTSIVKVQRPHVLVDVLAYHGISLGFEPHDDAVGVAVFDNIVHGEVEVQEYSDEFLELRLVLGVVLGSKVES
jgi:uncharacterized membrane protein (DUF441 family)